jgi:hypothetical protein
VHLLFEEQPERWTEVDLRVRDFETNKVLDSIVLGRALKVRNIPNRDDTKKDEIVSGLISTFHSVMIVPLPLNCKLILHDSEIWNDRGSKCMLFISVDPEFERSLWKNVHAMERSAVGETVANIDHALSIE